MSNQFTVTKIDPPLADEDSSSEVWPAELQDDLGFVMELDFHVEEKEPYIEVLSPPPEPENQS